MQREYGPGLLGKRTLLLGTVEPGLSTEDVLVSQHRAK